MSELGRGEVPEMMGKASWLADRVFGQKDSFRMIGGDPFKKNETAFRITKDHGDDEDRYWIWFDDMKTGEKVEFRLFEEDGCLVGPTGEKVKLQTEDMERIKSEAVPE
jgi:hypothetical protein